MLKRIGCTPDQIKECLIALMYGAHQLDWDRAAIPSILRSRVTTTRFRHDPWVTALRSELRKGRDAILLGWPRPQPRLACERSWKEHLT